MFTFGADAYFTQFEKLVGVEGIAIVNVVNNPQAVDAGQEKVLKTMITFDDGALLCAL